VNTSPASAGGVGLELKNLRIVYDGFVAVADTSLRVEAGESFGIVGESGSGKSTVLRGICGLAPRASGSVQLVGGAGADLPAPGSKAFRRRVQMVFQDPYGSLHPRQTVDRILAEPLAIHGIGDAETRIERALDEVGLGTGFRFRYPHQLSGGQRQRIAIARAVLQRPRLLILDEATSALDSVSESLVCRNLAKEFQGKTVFFVTHRVRSVEHADRILVFDRGILIEQGRHEDLMKLNGHYHTLYTGGRADE
jgi:peptide/nickel transport system ATP-binding protein